MDRIANDGARFRNSFVVNSLCSPSRACFLTGQYNHINGVINNHMPFPVDSVTVATQLRQAGYKTGYFGKWHHDSQKGQRPGFDYSASFVGQGKYEDCPIEVNGQPTETKGWIDDVTTDYAIEFIKSHKSEPFFAFIGFKSPHDNRTPAARAANRFEGETIRPVPNLDSLPAYHQLADTPKSAAAKARGESLLNYFRCISAADDSLGRLLDALDSLKLRDSTAVIFASDNGYYHGEHGLADKRSAYEESMRIVTLFRYPPLVKKNQLVDQMALNIDLAPTILDMAGVEIPKQMQGRSWRPLLEGNPGNWRKSFFYEYFYETRYNTPTITALRTDSAKLIKYAGHDEWTELFDLAKDPFEMNNLFKSEQHAELRKQMEEEYDRQSQAVKFQIPENIDKPQ